MTNYSDKILLDADFLVALAYPADKHNEKAKNILFSACAEKPLFFTNQYLISETLTVVLIRSKMISLVKEFKNELLEKYQKIIRIKYIGKEWEKDIYDLFINQSIFKGDFLSFSDCSLIVQARKQNIKTIFTFDRAFKQFAKEFKIVGI